MGPAERIRQRLRRLDEALLRRSYPGEGPVGEEGTGGIDARSNDYLGMAGSRVSRETVGEVSCLPLGAGASRLVSGTTGEHIELERELAEWLGTEAALLFTSAYAANVGVLSALGERGDVILSDALNHASIIDGCRLSRAEVVVYPHLDIGAVEARLRERRGAAGQLWVVSESYFGMDADTPDLAALRALCDEHGAGLIVDEAHAVGVFGEEGRGLCAAMGVSPDVLVGGFGKALGVQGGFVAASRDFVEWLWNRARTFVFSTASSPLLARAARVSLAGVRGDGAGRKALRDREALLAKRLVEGSVALTPGRHGPIFPVVLGAEASALRVAGELRMEGIFVQPIRPPTVRAGTSRLRVIVRADMTVSDLETLADGLVRALAGEAIRAAASPDAAGREPQNAHNKSGTEDSHGDAEVAGPGRVRGAPSGAADVGSGCVAAGLEPPGAARGVQGLDGDLPRGESDASEHVDPRRAQNAPPPGTERQGAKGARRAPVAGSALGAARGSAAGGPARSLGADSAWLRAPRWIVLGTGTGVGKTHVAVGLVGRLARAGLAVAGLKPIETGVTETARGDATALQQASFHVKHPTPHPLYAFPQPVTPALAARRANCTIDSTAIREWMERVVPTTPGEATATVVETAGGAFSPLAPDLDNFRLALGLGEACWVLVAMDRLGVLHEVASTLRAMAALGRSPDCLVLNAPAEPDASTGTNMEELREMGIALPIVLLGRSETEPLDAIVALRPAPALIR